MERPAEFWHRLLFLFRRGRLDRDLEDEMQFHLEMKARQNCEAGMDADEARYAARRSFGSTALLCEDSREAWGWGAAERILKDVKFAARTMARDPAVTCVAVVVLALGIGANTAIFSVVNAVLINPYPFPDPHRLVYVEAQHSSGRNSGTGYRDYQDWRDQNAVFEEMAIPGWSTSYTLTGGDEPERISGTRTTESFFRVLGVEPLLGRFFTAEEDRPGAPRVAVVSYAAWQRRFGGSAGILGRTLTLNDNPYTIIGVMPKRFSFPGLRNCDFWEPLREGNTGRYQHQYAVVARLKPGITVERAQADMTAIARRLEQQYPETNTGWGIAVFPIAQALAQQARKPVGLLFATVVFILVLGCANVAGLLLARASGRAKEIAIRASLGASRARLMRQMLTESVLLAATGGALGLVFAHWLMRVLVATVPEDFGLEPRLGIDPAVLAFTAAVAVLTGIAFGIAPALYGSKTDLTTGIKSAANAGGARSRNRALSALVVGEVALSLVLLAGAALLMKDLAVVLRMDTGVRTEHVLTFAVELPRAKYSSAQRTTGFFEELLDRLRAAPGIVAAGAVSTLPMTGGYSGGGFEIEGRPKPADWMDMSAQYNGASPGYFAAMGIRILRGRDFEERDSAGGTPVAIINETLARRFFPNEDPVGRRIELRGRRTIVGIAAPVKHQKPMRPPVPMIYLPLAQSPDSSPWVTIRTAGDPAKMAAAVRGLVRRLDPSLPVLRMRTMRQVVSDSMSEPRLMAAFLGGFAAFALALAAVGIYGLMAYSVAQRTHEMGVRLSLGATRASVLALVLRRGAALTFVGVAIGLPAALATARIMAALLHGIAALDAQVFTAAAAVLILAGLAASYVPARRATRVDPMEALRCE